MIFILDDEIIVSEKWFIKGKQLITAENGPIPFLVTDCNSNIIKNIDFQLRKHSSFLDLRSKRRNILDNFLESFVQIPEKKYSMQKTPVTQELYEKIIGEKPSTFECEDNPVENVSWYDAVYFCNKLSEFFGLEPVYFVDGKKNISEWNYVPNTGDSIPTKIIQDKNANGFRLPTIKEWQYAANGNQNYIYSGSDNLNEIGWCRDNCNSQIHPVAQKNPNGYGLYDMSGNIWEWCWDFSEEHYKHHSLCGGSWIDEESDCLVTAQIYNSACFRFCNIGFRVVRTTK